MDARNSEKRPFDSNKLLRSLEVATRKRPVSPEDLEKIVSAIIKKLDKYGEGEIESSIVGQLVMDELAKIDEVSYVRYASVYKDFSKATDFGKLIAEISNDK